MSPIVVILALAVAASAAAWIASLATNDHSWVDRAWSILPPIYVWVVALMADPTDPRLLVMAILVTFWGVRLTYNFARKGGYRGVEDYRWAILRGRMPRWRFELLNLFFIVLFQNALLVLITLPALVVSAHPTPLTLVDAFIALLFLTFLAAESRADRQLWDFHQWKKLQVRAGNDPRPRFVESGWWRYSRHPNFFFEQAQWWTLYLFAVIATGLPLNVAVVGPVLLTMLFVGSTVFTESITRSRYPEYALRQAAVSAWLPLPTRPLARPARKSQ